MHRGRSFLPRSDSAPLHLCARLSATSLRAQEARRIRITIAVALPPIPLRMPKVQIRSVCCLDSLERGLLRAPADNAEDQQKNVNPDVTRNDTHTRHHQKPMRRILSKLLIPAALALLMVCQASGMRLRSSVDGPIPVAVAAVSQPPDSAGDASIYSGSDSWPDLKTSYLPETCANDPTPRLGESSGARALGLGW